MILGLVSLLGAGCDGGGGGGTDGGDGDAADGQDGDGRDGDDGQVVLALLSVNPAYGPVEGGTLVTLTGRGFQPGAGVSFGASAGTGVEYLSATALRATTPAAPGAPGRVAVRVQNPGGESASLPDGFEYQEAQRPEVGWCGLHHPAATQAAPGTASEPIYGWAWVLGCSEGSAQCGLLQGELGYGAVGADPSQAPQSFQWVTAAYNPGHTGDDNDEYQASLSVPAAGSYAYAYRFSVDGGASWAYCDLDGLANGFQAGQLGALTVATQDVTIGWCGLHWPAATSVAPGVSTEPIYGRVYAAGCTEGGAHCGALQAELGWGDPAENPSQDPAAFEWLAAAYNAAHADDDNDEYLAALTPPAEGLFAYVYRFSADGGASWTYCDRNGSADGFQRAEMGSLTVQAAAVSISYCALQWPAQMDSEPGQASPAVYGQVFAAGCTDGAARCAEVTAELGFGAAGADPSSAPGDFQWVAAAYNDQHTGDDNDEYLSTLSTAGAGTYAYAYRFSADGGARWHYCDLDGSLNGFQPGQQGVWRVGAAPPPVGWCILQHPAATSTVAGLPSEPIYGRVFVEGCSTGDLECQAVRAEVGLGDPALSPVDVPQAYAWVAATYNPGHTGDDNDEYTARLTPAADGAYAYAYRFSTDGGTTWTACDLDGTDNGFDFQRMGALTAADRTVGWCGLQFPTELTLAAGQPAGDFFGRVFVDQCTAGAAGCQGLRGELGLGPDGIDPSADPGAFSWFAAGYNPGHTEDDNDEYQAPLTAPAQAGVYRFLFRFSGDNGATWSYCDRAGSPDGFLPSDQGTLTVQ